MDKSYKFEHEKQKRELIAHYIGTLVIFILWV